MGAILLILGILFSADALAVMFISFEIGAFFTFMIGILLILWGANHKKIKHAKGFLRLFRALMKIGIIYIIAASCFLAVFGNISDTNYTEKYVVVLGCGVKNSVPTMPLKQRLDKACEYAQKNPYAVIIVSGGQGSNENIAEADVMYSYLTDKGIKPARIIRESKSNTTYENFRRSDEITGGALSQNGAAVITNGFHMFRAKLYAKLCGIEIKSCPAKTSIYYVPVYYTREALSLIKTAVYYVNPKS